MMGALLWLFLIAWSILWIPCALVVKLIGRDEEVLLRMARERWAPGIVRVFSTEFEVRGADQLDPSLTYLFVANHLSHFDVPVLMRAIPFGIRFLAKQQLRWIPLLGRFIAASGMVFVDRSSPRRASESLEVLTSKLRAGQSSVAFPEGHRSRTGELGAFKLGPFKAANDARVSVVPIAIEGTRTIWPAEKKPNGRGRVRVEIGKGILSSGPGAVDIAELVNVTNEAIVAMLSSTGTRDSR